MLRIEVCEWWPLGCNFKSLRKIGERLALHPLFLQEPHMEAVPKCPLGSSSRDPALQVVTESARASYFSSK